MPQIRLALIVLGACCISGCGQSGPSTAKQDSTTQQDSHETSEITSETEVEAPAGSGNTAAAQSKSAEIQKTPYENPLTTDQQLNGWLSLFDGQTLFGWESTSEDINWEVVDGVITADSGPIGCLMTTVPYVDYELVCEYRMVRGGNSGLFLRTNVPPGNIATECYEVNIADEHPDGFTTAALVNRQKAETEIERTDDWNEFRIVVDGAHVVVQHNGVQALDYTSEPGQIAPIGRIGLQKNAGKIEFRKILLKPLNLESIFDGQSLTGWKTVPGSKSEFTVENGEIHVSNGPGFLETEQTYKDFILQAHAQTHAQDLNSGIFFRAMDGTEEAPSNGYEFQVHNGFNSDRFDPKDSGTGAIFRRVKARYVVANDEEWLTATLIAHGPHIATFVNGYQVVDWVDDREPDPNPRRGQRLEGGHLSLQGHDPTTDLSFKNLKIREFPSE